MFRIEVSFPSSFCFPDFCNAASVSDGSGKRRTLSLHVLPRQAIMTDTAAL